MKNTNTLRIHKKTLLGSEELADESQNSPSLFTVITDASCSEM